MAKQFENGVLWFTKAQLAFDVYFPENEVKCQYCPFCRSDIDLKRYFCRITGKMLYNPFAAELPDGCPITVTGEIYKADKEE